MEKFTQNLEFYIEQYDLERQIFKMGKIIKKKGCLEKEEFLKICLWKSRRPKKLYNSNTEEEIIFKTKSSFKEINEVRKINILTELKGVRIATASALLSVYDPKIYPIIDERCIQSLLDLGLITWKTITDKNWVKYLEIVRNLAIEKNKTAREIEKGLFAYNRINLDQNLINLYKQ